MLRELRTATSGTNSTEPDLTIVSEAVDNLKEYSFLAWIVGGFLIVALLLSAMAPISIRRLYGDRICKSKPALVGFEGTMPIEEAERLTFGNSAGRLTYAPSSTTFCKANRHPMERKGTASKWVDEPMHVDNAPKLPPGHRLFTLVDMADMSVSIISAERPPTVALLCGREGGMVWAVLCSWRFETDCLFKETVIRVPSSVYEVAVTNDWLKLCLSTQNQHARSPK